MLTLVLRRALTQRRLLIGIVMMVTLGTTFLGVGALMLDTTQDRAFTAGVRESAAHDVDVTAFVLDVAASEQVSLRDDARSVVSEVLAPLRPSLTNTAVSRMRRFGDGRRLGYLTSTDSLTTRSALTSGRWIRGPDEAVVPQSTARRLHLELGDHVVLDQEIGTDPVKESVGVVVVGTFRATSRSGWQGDPLAGSGYDPAYSDGSVPDPLPTYGPFVVDDATLLSSGSTVASLRVTGQPTLTRATRDSMAAVVDALGSADGLLSARAGDQAQITRVASDLPQTLDRVRAQQASTRSTVLVVLLLGTALALSALLMAGRLLAAVRETERALLTDLGRGRAQLAATTVAETTVVAAVAAAVATPLAAIVHSGLTHLPMMRTAGLDQVPAISPSLVLTEVIGAVLLSLALAVPALSLPGPRGRGGRAARSGVDLVLVAVAVIAWWQLHSQPSTDTSGDATRAVAPVVFVLAATAVAMRGVQLFLTALAAAAARRRGLVLPLATGQAARRPHAGVALILLALAAASATFAISLQATWERSQGDQAALRVGSDLVLGLPASATDRDAAQIASAARGTVSSAVTDRPLALGRYVGVAGSAPMIVAVDSRRAGTLLRGRLDHDRTWAGIGRRLSPGPAVQGAPLSSDGVTITGASPDDVAVDVTPTLVVQDASGFRSTVIGARVPLDGQTHAVQGLSDVDGTQLVAVQLTVGARPGQDASGIGDVSVALSVAGPGRPKSSSGVKSQWHVRVLEASDSPITSSAVSVEPTARGTTVRATAQVDLGFLSFADGDLLATAFTAPTTLPVAVSQQLADAADTSVGGTLSATVGGTEMRLHVTAVVPTIPSAPGSVAVLADADALSRVLIDAGRLEPAVDAWWFARPGPETERALRVLDIGDVTTRAGAAVQLEHGPLRASVPASLILLVVASGLLLIAGAALMVGADRPKRSSELARLRALGLTRAEARRLVFLEDGILLGFLVVTGALVGAIASVVLGPDLIRSDIGVAPVPAALPVWPWVRELVVVLGGLGGCLVIAAVMSAILVRQRDAAEIRRADS